MAVQPGSRAAVCGGRAGPGSDGATGVAGWKVSADTNTNARHDAGERWDRADRFGRYALRLVPAGATVRLQDLTATLRGTGDAAVAVGGALTRHDFPAAATPPATLCVTLAAGEVLELSVENVG